MSNESSCAEPLAGPVPRAARAATSGGLFVLGIVFASWMPRIPEVKEALDLSDGELGLTLLGAPAGSVLTMWAVGLLVQRFGSVPVIQVSLPAYCLVAVLVAAAGNPPLLFAILALWGAAGGALDVAVNAQGTEVEKQYGRPIMSGLHAAWTAGALCGAGVGTAGAALAIPIGWQLAATGAFGLAVGMPLTRTMLPRAALTRVDMPVSMELRTSDAVPMPCAAVAEAAPLGSPANALSRLRYSQLPVTLCVICLSSFLCEGVVGDWSALYLRDSTGAPVGVAGLGLVMFTVTMLAGRLLGDRVVRSVGAGRAIRVSAGTASGVFLIALALGDTSVGTFSGVVAFGFLGAGVACVVPLAISAAAGNRQDGLGSASGTAVAAVVSFGYVGWFLGPPLIGGLAELVGLQAALLCVVVLTALVAILAPALSG